MGVYWLVLLMSSIDILWIIELIIDFELIGSFITCNFSYSIKYYFIKDIFGWVSTFISIIILQISQHQYIYYQKLNIRLGILFDPY